MYWGYIIQLLPSNWHSLRIILLAEGELIAMVPSHRDNNCFISLPEPKAHWLAYSIPMVRRPSSASVHIFKHLLQNHLADQSQILCGASLGRGTIFCSRHLGHMTKMAATPIYGKNPSKIFSRTGGSIFTRLGM